MTKHRGSHLFAIKMHKRAATKSSKHCMTSGCFLPPLCSWWWQWVIIYWNQSSTEIQRKRRFLKQVFQGSIWEASNWGKSMDLFWNSFKTLHVGHFFPFSTFQKVKLESLCSSWDEGSGDTSTQGYLAAPPSKGHSSDQWHTANNKAWFNLKPSRQNQISSLWLILSWLQQPFKTSSTQLQREIFL